MGYEKIFTNQVNFKKTLLFQCDCHGPTMSDDSLNDFVPSNNPTKNNKCNPRIFIICLPIYSNRLQRGKSIDSAQKILEIQKEIKKSLLESPARNDENFESQSPEKLSFLDANVLKSINTIQKITVFISEVGEVGAELLAYYNDIDSAQKAWKNHYQGEYENELEFAIELFDKLYMDSISEIAQGYIDYASFRKDIFIDDYLSIIVNGKAHIFARC